MYKPKQAAQLKVLIYNIQNVSFCLATTFLIHWMKQLNPHVGYRISLFPRAPSHKGMLRPNYSIGHKNTCSYSWASPTIVGTNAIVMA